MITNGSLPSAIAGDSYDATHGVPMLFAWPVGLSTPPYTALPPYWSWARDVALVKTLDMEAMWAAAVAKSATKFAARGYTVEDAQDSQRRVASSQELLKRADGGAGWVPFAEKIVQDLATCDNGVFIRLRREGETAERVRIKEVVSELGGERFDGFSDVIVTNNRSTAPVTGLYHLDSLRCTRTGNLAYPVRYQSLTGAWQLLRWDQVLLFADQPSPRASLLGVGRSAASRAYVTIAKLAAMEQMVYEFLTSAGANKLAFLQGLSEQTLRGIVQAGEQEAAAKGLLYYKGVIIGAIPSDVPITLTELVLKQLAPGFDAKTERDNAYLIYANALGIPVQDIQPLSGQGLGTGTQTVVLEEAAQGIGMAAFLKWWEQTVSDRVLPATTTLQFENEHDTRDQKARAEVAKLRAEERKTRIESGEISPAVARQLAADIGDLPQELLAADVTPGDQLSDDEKPSAIQPSAASLQLAAGMPLTMPSGQDTAPALKEATLRIDAALAEALAWLEASDGDD